METIKKRYSIIDQHFKRHFKNNGAGLLSPRPFLCSQIITPFSHLMLSANQERGLWFLKTVESEIITPFSHLMLSTNQERGLWFLKTVESVYPYSSCILQFLFNKVWKPNSHKWREHSCADLIKMVHMKMLPYFGNYFHTLNW